MNDQSSYYNGGSQQMDALQYEAKFNAYQNQRGALSQHKSQGQPQKSIYQNAFGASYNQNPFSKQQPIVNGEQDQKFNQAGKNFGVIPQGSKNLFSRDFFKCECGYELQQKELKQHFDACFSMNSKYQGLFFCLNHEINECQGDITRLKNLKAIMSSFNEVIGEKIKSQNPIGGQINNRNSNKVDISLEQFQIPQNIGNPPLIHNIPKNQPPQKNEPIFDQNLNEDLDMKNFEEEKFNDFRVSEEEESCCSKCNKQFTPQEVSDGQKQFIQSTDCFHLIHVKCIIDQVFENFPQTQTAPCPHKGCGKAIQEFEFNQYLSAEQKSKLEELVSKAIMNQSSNVVVCKCGNAMELVEGKIDLNQKDDQGKKISKEAATHMAKFRVRCTCGKIFCSKCKEEPYHLGYNCEQFQEMKNSRKCRYCQTKINKEQKPLSNKPAFINVCTSSECVTLMKQSCDKVHKCGHFCCGFANEPQCLPCLDPDCVAKAPEKTLSQNADAYCSICFIAGLGEKPSVRLDCQHIFHLDCVMSILKKRWPGPRVVFNYLNCTTCKRKMKATYCHEISTCLIEAEKYEEDLKKKAIERGKHEGLDKHERLKDSKDHYYDKFQEYCLFKLAYYECFKCHSPYFGGMKDCQNNQGDAPGQGGAAGQAAADQNYKKEELVCAKCAAVGIEGGVKNCPKHGLDYIEFKCKFCCNVAQWFCWGNTHFCEPCHKKQNEGDYVSRKKKSDLPKCPGEKHCPLKIKHPENGEEFALGCVLCRNLKDNIKDF